MLHPAHYVIRPATPDDSAVLDRLAQLDSQRMPDGAVLIGEIDGHPAAAVSLRDGRVVADPFRRTAQLGTYLRVRAAALNAHEAEPSLARRMLAAIPRRLRARAATA